MKRLIFALPLVLLYACAPGDVIQKIECSYSGKKNPDFKWETSEIFNNKTGEIYEFDDFEEVLVAKKKLRKEGYAPSTTVYQSVMQENTLKVKHDLTFDRDYLYGTSGESGTIVIYTTDLEKMTQTTGYTHKLGMQPDDFSEADSCKFVEPPTTKVKPEDQS